MNTQAIQALAHKRIRYDGTVYAVYAHAAQDLAAKIADRLEARQARKAPIASRLELERLDCLCAYAALSTMLTPSFPTK